MTKPRTICVQLTGSSYDGQWIVVNRPPVGVTREGTEVVLVPTGTVEWDGNHCAEVFVPLARLDAWLSEHVL